MTTNLISPSLNYTDEELNRYNQNYQQDGYVLLKSFLSPREVEYVKSALAQLIQETVPTMPEHHVFYEDKANKDSLKQLQNIDSYHPFFEHMLKQSRFRAIAQVLLRDQVIPKNFQYFNKPPKLGQPTPPHQDGFYFKLNPCEAVTMWLALEEVDEINGCVRYIPGSHRDGMRPHSSTKTLGFSQGILDYSPDDFNLERSFPASPGDLLVHHALTIHRADRNNAEDRTRKALGLIYYAERAREDREAKEAYSRQLIEKMKSQNQI